MVSIVELLVRETGLSEFAIRKVAASAPDAYKEYFIKKKNGGLRKIAHPAKELKVLQRALNTILLSNLPVHDAAMAYQHGKNIRTNALAHAGSSQILKMDFKDFFPSIKVNDWKIFCDINNVFSEFDDLEITSNILFHRPKGLRKLRLAIGAPSSPMLSNVLMFDFDQRLTEVLRKDHVVYTRYADDLTFSAPRTGYLNSVQKAVRGVIRDIDVPKLSINHEKTVYVTMKFHRSVTGLTLSNDGRVTIGREKKRLIRAALHNFSTEKKDRMDPKWCAGMLSYTKSAEPDFYNKLIQDYGFEVIRSVLRSGAVNKKAR